MGRPANDDYAYRVRTMAWFNAVSQASGGMNARDLEILFGMPTKKEKYTPGARPGIWKKYETGFICPKYKPDANGRPSIVERVEARFPGTARWITLPFWDVLSYRRFSMDELRGIYLKLAPQVRSLVVMDTGERASVFWRRPVDAAQLYADLLAIGDLDASTAILGLIKEAEITQNQGQHQMGLLYWSLWSSRLQHPVLARVHKHINWVIEDRYTHITYAEEGNYYCLTKQLVRSALAGKLPLTEMPSLLPSLGNVRR